ncbi:macrophage mannose receptor 1-like [Puntigrus tetrazona]|uniref:macrophage mannose receptor 1-like n=1 Tax=Puntigrus tetrazona TaxID=1606681 RepID=UPI001C89800F|nr:macrophage mannose receptor 1-like [Puntigrus tetrazona]
MYLVLLDPKTWTEAQSYCREEHVDLATVQSDKDRAKLKEAANDESFQSFAWIALQRRVLAWRWSYLNAASSFTKWESWEPDTSRTEEACAFIDGNRLWGDASCTQENTSSVKLVRNYTTLIIWRNGRKNNIERREGKPDDEQESRRSSKEKKLDKSQTQDKFKFIQTSLNWREAQVYCRTLYTDLATVTDDSENTALADLMYKNNVWEAWIGLSKNLWLWSDGTGVSRASVTWESGQPDNVNGDEECACAGTEGQTADDACSTRRPFYCKTYDLMKKQLVRVSFKSSGHLDPSAAMQAFEEKMNQILSDQGMNAGSSVTWRVQPDGEIFQQTNTTETRPSACEEQDETLSNV